MEPEVTKVEEEEVVATPEVVAKEIPAEEAPVAEVAPEVKPEVAA